ncbi:MAG: response regulator transcription factor [Gammaproteobacteria bacterium]|nr:response regulator transcription factor [Gammaproteobacteria bacterium]NNL07406.1 response regulator transcription factor [Gammaproteobacteria bacterium]
MKILVVEDDQQVARQIETSLKNAGYVVEVVHDGEEGLYLGRNESFDAVILDLGLPKIDGIKVLQQWRNENRDMPVLILTARDTWREKVVGLRAGADDYLSKPFEIEEVLARVEALIRRATGHGNPVLSCANVEFDTTSNRVTNNGTTVELTALELGMLSYLMHHKGEVISKSELTEHIYDQDFDRDSNVIEVLVNRLRNKLGASLIKTHRGLGYQLVDPDDS